MFYSLGLEMDSFWWVMQKRLGSPLQKTLLGTSLSIPWLPEDTCTMVYQHGASDTRSTGLSLAARRNLRRNARVEVAGDPGEKQPQAPPADLLRN